MRSDNIIPDKVDGAAVVVAEQLASQHNQISGDDSKTPPITPRGQGTAKSPSSTPEKSASPTTPRGQGTKPDSRRGTPAKLSIPPRSPISDASAAKTTAYGSDNTPSTSSSMYSEAKISDLPQSAPAARVANGFDFSNTHPRAGTPSLTTAVDGSDNTRTSPNTRSTEEEKRPDASQSASAFGDPRLFALTGRAQTPAATATANGYLPPLGHTERAQTPAAKVTAPEVMQKFAALELSKKVMNRIEAFNINKNTAELMLPIMQYLGANLLNEAMNPLRALTKSVSNKLMFFKDGQPAITKQPKIYPSNTVVLCAYIEVAPLQKSRENTVLIAWPVAEDLSSAHGYVAGSAFLGIQGAIIKELPINESYIKNAGELLVEYKNGASPVIMAHAQQTGSYNNRIGEGYTSPVLPGNRQVAQPLWQELFTSYADKDSTIVTLNSGDKLSLVKALLEWNKETKSHCLRTNFDHIEKIDLSGFKDEQRLEINKLLSSLGLLDQLEDKIICRQAPRPS